MHAANIKRKINPAALLNIGALSGNESGTRLVVLPVRLPDGRAYVIRFSHKQENPPNRRVFLFPDSSSER